MSDNHPPIDDYGPNRSETPKNLNRYRSSERPKPQEPIWKSWAEHDAWAVTGIVLGALVVLVLWYTQGQA